jgi:hypothetical protein
VLTTLITTGITALPRHPSPIPTHPQMLEGYSRRTRRGLSGYSKEFAAFPRQFHLHPEPITETFHAPQACALARADQHADDRNAHARADARADHPHAEARSSASKIPECPGVPTRVIHCPIQRLPTSVPSRAPSLKQNPTERPLANASLNPRPPHSTTEYRRVPKIACCAALRRRRRRPPRRPRRRRRRASRSPSRARTRETVRTLLVLGSTLQWPPSAPFGTPQSVPSEPYLA